MQNRSTTKRIKKKRRSENNVEQRTRTITFEPIERHGYSEFIVRLSTLLYTRVNCGLRQVVEILTVINDAFFRFIYFSGWVKWSSKMLDIHHTLQADEQKIFSFIPANASLIDELSEVIRCINSIEHVCKHGGLSKKTICKCQKEIEKYLLCDNSRMIHLGECIIKFLAKEAMLIGADVAVLNNSSDILESLFGRYKARKSPNKLNGVTPYILFVPIYTKLSSDSQAQKLDFKATLENKRMREIDVWAKDNLSQNLVSLRNNQLQKAG